MLTYKSVCVGPKNKETYYSESYQSVLRVNQAFKAGPHSLQGLSVYQTGYQC